MDIYIKISELRENLVGNHCYERYRFIKNNNGETIRQGMGLEGVVKKVFTHPHTNEILAEFDTNELCGAIWLTKDKSLKDQDMSLEETMSIKDEYSFAKKKKFKKDVQYPKQMKSNLDSNLKFAPRCQRCRFGSYMTPNHPCKNGCKDLVDSVNNDQVKIKESDLKQDQNICSEMPLAQFVLPLQMVWKPKEDITTYELALCFPYLNKSVMPYEIDENLPHFRHFEIINPNKNK